MKNSKETALEYLEKNSLFHMGMIFPVKRGSAEIIYAESDGVFIKDTTSGAYMLSIENFDKGRKLVDEGGRKDLFCVCQKSVAEYLEAKYKYGKCMENYQAVYTGKEPVETGPAELSIQPLTPGHLDMVYKHYHDDVDYDYLKRRLELGAIYGGFLKGELCGFAGSHEEGSIGILKVLEKYRRRGFAYALEAYMVNLFLERGDIPFAQVKPENEASIRLHKKLGFDISAESLYWLFD